MAATIKREVAAPVEAVWQVVTDFAGYGQDIPFTTISHDTGAPGLGWHFTGNTRVGPLRLDDPMVITRWSPPTAETSGFFAVAKEGSVLSGWAEVEVRRGHDPARCVLLWSEQIRLRPLPLPEVLIGPVADVATRVLFGRAVAAMAERAQRLERG